MPRHVSRTEPSNQSKERSSGMEASDKIANRFACDAGIARRAALIRSRHDLNEFQGAVEVLKRSDKEKDPVVGSTGSSNSSERSIRQIALWFAWLRFLLEGLSVPEQFRIQRHRPPGGFCIPPTGWHCSGRTHQGRHPGR